MKTAPFQRFPLVMNLPQAKTWLKMQADLGLTNNTIMAYGRALEDYLNFCRQNQADPNTVTREHLAAYVRDLRNRPNRVRKNLHRMDSGAGLSNATLQQRLTAVRLYYDYLVEEGVRVNNPVGRGRYTPGKAFGNKRERGLIQSYRKLPWIPTDEEWLAILKSAQQESFRNRVMLAMAYDAALRREELCSLETGDIDPAHRLLTIRAETTKNRLGRVVPYSEPTGELFAAYLRCRREMCSNRGPLFISESRRNRSEPITIWTWSKVIRRISERSGVRHFTTHTTRHLCLTDLARAGWDIHEIASFAGHRNPQTTLLYIHLSGRDLSEKLACSIQSIHNSRVELTAEVLA